MSALTSVCLWITLLSDACTDLCLSKDYAADRLKLACLWIMLLSAACPERCLSLDFTTGYTPAEASIYDQYAQTPQVPLLLYLCSAS